MSNLLSRFIGTGIIKTIIDKTNLMPITTTDAPPPEPEDELFEKTKDQVFSLYDDLRALKWIEKLKKRGYLTEEEFHKAIDRFREKHGLERFNNV